MEMNHNHWEMSVVHENIDLMLLCPCSPTEQCVGLTAFKELTCYHELADRKLFIVIVIPDLLSISRSCLLVSN